MTGDANGTFAPIAPADMAQCGVTGVWCRQDEMVRFQGQLVSAAGKQILVEQLQTGSTALNELDRPSVSRRLVCMFMDSVLFSTFSFGVLFISGIPLLRAAEAVQQSAHKLLVYGLCLCICNVVFIIYFGILHGILGQSLGKIFGDLRVVKLDGSKPSVGRSFARAVVFCIGGLAVGVICIVLAVAGKRVELSHVVFVGNMWLLLDACCALLDRKRQRALHDMICGTRFVQKCGV